ncbi:uncharacterized protein B0H64DRAFT_353969 [Chaetomium fimeti]|uniref:Alpha-ketoglutarate-dependent dioxygenase AlkB-like domain-containing protein n=1 Tax=Chaetomium fimeti TaxID=1854472 RepID=A0AAE0LVI6_9PEZI|nr:hypothetical protein B0H64DRAFT_353969 [Chaetomium fimeti]
MDSVTETGTARQSSITNGPNDSAGPPIMAAPRTSPRPASLCAETAMKRNIEDLGANEDDEPTKRARLSAAPKVDEAGSPQSSQSDTLQSALDTPYVEDNHNQPMQTIMASMAGPIKKRVRARKVKIANATADGPPPSGKPLVWADARGSLCEALPYFKAFKSSLHSANLVCQGFLIDQEADELDVFGTQVIISSVGGGRVKNPKTGTMIRAKDGDDAAPNTKAIPNAHGNKSLVAGHPFYPCCSPHPYAVLGYFHITDVWKEKQITEGSDKPVTVWRMRFEKADLAERSWWAPKSEKAVQTDALVDTSLKAPVITCAKCDTPSKEMFTAGWFCLNYGCEHYFVFPTGAGVDIKGLAYTQTFLDERTPFVGEIPSVVPPITDSTGLHGTEKSLRRGFVCPDCGCCNRRVYWNRWVCANKECEYTRDAPMLPYPGDLLQLENARFDEKMRRIRNSYGVNDNKENKPGFVDDPIATIYNRDCLPLSQTLTLGGYDVRQYYLPNSDGKILGSFSIFSAKPEILTKPNGPDDLFQTLELTDIGLRRNAAAVVGHKLEGYTRHFQQNFGAKYKFGVTVQSKGLDEAPDVILRALQRLIWAKQVSVDKSNAFICALDQNTIGKHAIVPTDGDFNELLALGYMEDDKINYHDDGEHELGPVVAALSLGSPSTMRFRPKGKTGFLVPARRDRGKDSYQAVLEVPMKHGDMMVMVGTEIQKVYEHTVIPHGTRRFSLTARYMDPERMTTQQDRDDVAVKGAMPKHAEAFAYDGF